MPSPGIEPGLRPSQGRVHPPHSKDVLTQQQGCPGGVEPTASTFTESHANRYTTSTMKRQCRLEWRKEKVESRPQRTSPHSFQTPVSFYFLLSQNSSLAAKRPCSDQDSNLERLVRSEA